METDEPEDAETEDEEERNVCRDPCPWGCPDGCTGVIGHDQLCNHEWKLDGEIRTHVWGKGDGRVPEPPSDLEPLPLHLRRPPWEKMSPPGKCCLCGNLTIWGQRYLAFEDLMSWRWICATCRGVSR
jgi:hypothetical protein